MTTYAQKITFGEMRESGTRDVLIYCRDHKCCNVGNYSLLAPVFLISASIIPESRGASGLA
jgi:hypothetical protein